MLAPIAELCNCNYIVFTKLPWPGDSEGTFRSSSQGAFCPPVYHTRRRLHTVPLIAERQAGMLGIPIFKVFGLTRPGIEPESTATVADALSTRPLIGMFFVSNCPCPLRPFCPCSLVSTPFCLGRYVGFRCPAALMPRKYKNTEQWWPLAGCYASVTNF